MHHEQFTEWLYLSVFDELGADERRQLDAHVQTCEACQSERERVVRMLDTITVSGVGEPAAETLAGAQQSLRAALWRESMAQVTTPRGTSFIERVFGVGRGFRLGLAGAAVLSIGFLIGYIAFHSGAATTIPDRAPAAGDLYPGIANVRLIDLDPIDGRVDIAYDQVRPVRLKASADDPRVRDVLAYALLNDENPGVRLKAINAFESGEMGAVPRELKEAFLEALASDPNAGVRLQALLILRKLPFDADVKRTLLFALSHDENPGIRIAAMNFLAEATLEGTLPEQEMYDILRKREAAGKAIDRPTNDT